MAKTPTFTIRLDEADRKLVDAIAGVCGLTSVAAVVRFAIRQEARRRGLIAAEKLKQRKGKK